MGNGTLNTGSNQSVFSVLTHLFFARLFIATPYVTIITFLPIWLIRRDRSPVLIILGRGLQAGF